MKVLDTLIMLWKRTREDSYTEFVVFRTVACTLMVPFVFSIPIGDRLTDYQVCAIICGVLLVIEFVISMPDLSNWLWALPSLILTLVFSAIFSIFPYEWRVELTLFQLLSYIYISFVVTPLFKHLIVGDAEKSQDAKNS